MARASALQQVTKARTGSLESQEANVLILKTRSTSNYPCKLQVNSTLTSNRVMTRSTRLAVVEVRPDSKTLCDRAQQTAEERMVQLLPVKATLLNNKCKVTKMHCKDHLSSVSAYAK